MATLWQFADFVIIIFYIRAGKKMNIQYTVQYQCTHYSDYSWN